MMVTGLSGGPVLPHHTQHHNRVRQTHLGLSPEGSWHLPASFQHGWLLLHPRRHVEQNLIRPHRSPPFRRVGEEGRVVYDRVHQRADGVQRAGYLHPMHTHPQALESPHDRRELLAKAGHH